MKSLNSILEEITISEKKFVITIKDPSSDYKLRKSGWNNLSQWLNSTKDKNKGKVNKKLNKISFTNEYDYKEAIYALDYFKINYSIPKS